MRSVLALVFCCGAGAPIPPKPPAPAGGLRTSSIPLSSIPLGLRPLFLAKRGLDWNSSFVASGASASKSTILDLSKVSGAQDLGSFGGACQFENYGYLAPKGEAATGFQSTVVQFDITTFSPETVKTLDLKEVSKEDDNTKLEYYIGCFVSGEFGYLVPGKGDVVRFNLKTFTLDSVEVLDLKENMQEYHGGFAAGGYGYLVPSLFIDDEDEEVASGKVVRFDLATFKEKQVMDVETKDAKLKGFHGGFSDGTYGYLVPYSSTVIARFALADFDATKVETIDLSVLDPEGHKELHDFRGGFVNGEYGYLVPARGGNMVRFTLANFKVSDVKLLDLPAVGKDDQLKGFDDAFVDPYGVAYLAPDTHTKVAKVTLATFADKTPKVEALDIAIDGGFMAAFADAGTGTGYLLPTSGGAKGKVVRLDDLFAVQTPAPTPAPSSGGGGGWVWIVVVLLLLAAGGGAGFYYYQQQQAGGSGGHAPTGSAIGTELQSAS